MNLTPYAAQSSIRLFTKSTFQDWSATGPRTHCFVIQLWWMETLFTRVAGLLALMNMLRVLPAKKLYWMVMSCGAAVSNGRLGSQAVSPKRIVQVFVMANPSSPAPVDAMCVTTTL